MDYSEPRYEVLLQLHTVTNIHISIRCKKDNWDLHGFSEGRRVSRFGSSFPLTLRLGRTASAQGSWHAYGMDRKEFSHLIAGQCYSLSALGPSLSTCRVGTHVRMELNNCQGKSARRITSDPERFGRFRGASI